MNAIELATNKLATNKYLANIFILSIMIINYINHDDELSFAVISFAIKFGNPNPLHQNFETH